LSRTQTPGSPVRNKMPDFFDFIPGSHAPYFALASGHELRPRSPRSSAKSTPYGERDSRSNPIQIKRSRTPGQSLKFNVQSIQRVTNSGIFPCDRCLLFSGDYKLPGRGGDMPHLEQNRLPISRLLSSGCASPLRPSLRFSAVCATLTGEGGRYWSSRGRSMAARSHPGFALRLFPILHQPPYWRLRPPPALATLQREDNPQ
jgi:hypothetical protein